MVTHVENLRRAHEREHAELEEARLVINLTYNQTVYKEIRML